MISLLLGREYSAYIEEILSPVGETDHSEGRLYCCRLDILKMMTFKIMKNCLFYSLAMFIKIANSDIWETTCSQVTQFFCFKNCFPGSKSSNIAKILTTRNASFLEVQLLLTV